MRKLLLLFFLSLTFQLIAQSQPSRKEGGNETAIRRILNKQSAAWNLGDITGFMNGYWENDSLMFIGKSGVTYGWSNTLNNYKKNYPDTITMGKLSFGIIVVKRLSKKYYQVVGKWFLKRSIGDLSGHFTLLFEKLNSRWVIIADHSS